MRRLFITFTLLFAIGCALVSAKPKRVACVGNSITYGYLLSERETNAYPFQLQKLLGNEYEIGNFGHTGATLLRRGYRPYFNTQEFKAALEFKPDIAVIHLGVNDTDPRAWPNYGDEFMSDYLVLIDSLRESNPNVRILVALLSPLRAGHNRFQTGTRDWRLEIQDQIRHIADISGAELIDFDTPLRDRQNLIFDNVHPNEEGASLLAQAAYSAITGNYGGLQLPEIYQSGMVLQRNRPLEISGRANAHAPIALTLDERTYHTTANNLGQWSLTTAPIVAGPEYTLVVTDGDTTLTLTNILAGEVWLASGQSNMEFYLCRAVGGNDAIAAAGDSLLRIYDQKEIVRTDDFLWPDSICEKIDRLEHYRPAHWQAVSPENVANFSAVAYFFGRRLRDSLNVPVGIISNPVGGSPAEAWIDVNTLEAEIPEIFLNWRNNDYLQPWVKQRIKDNIADRKLGRHPYEPSYLFSAAIRPLQHFPIAGVIWYQGESNAHNIEVHEHLFPLLVDSWRREFRTPQLPFYFVQLSGLNRPSWPAFRDSQRRLAQEIPGCAMVLSHDWGDSLDVHPRNKRPIADRLALLALSRSYGFAGLEDQGPTLDSAKALGSEIVLFFSHADGLTTSDGLAPRIFEIAETDGLYFPAEATIAENTITLKNMNVKNPRYVRYAWQPFTRSNLVNAAGLPASTFKSEVCNSADFTLEPGFEHGVSGAFGGLLNGQLIIAGGCNFPDDPLGATSQKRFYQGIYAADPATMEWRRIGSLPQPLAYGASATTPAGLIFIGGNDSRKVFLLNSNGLCSLPELPAVIDNAYAAADGNRVYLCGGNVDGKPSNALYCLDLDTKAPKWEKLKSMPGNPRVQPVMAAAGNKLYVWGGFAGKHNGKPATVETSGLCFDGKKWTSLPAPKNAQGDELTLGGGVALTLSDGRIAAAGGVNKDIFLAALQNQAPDYLFHPIPWYQFNQNVLVFDPQTANWSIAEVTPDAARAGAMAIAAPANSLYIYGGELKPRIRTNETIHFSF